MVFANSKETLKGKSAKATKIIKALSVANSSNVANEEKTTMEEKRPNPRVDGALIGRKT